MTMFTKGTWTLFNLDAPEINFTNKLPTMWETMPILAKSTAMNTKSEALGIAPYRYPRLGDVDEVAYIGEEALSMEEFLPELDQNWSYTPETNVIATEDGREVNLTDNHLWINDPAVWKVADGVYAFWLISFEWSDVHDLNSKKEALAYEYGSPFKFQPAEIKGSITEEAEKLDTIIRKQFQVILDFNLNRAWINTAAKPAISNLLMVMDNLDLSLADFRPEGDYNMEPQWSETFLKKLYDTSEYKNEFLNRAAEIKLHGVKGVEPEENGTMEKILKNYFSFSPLDGSATERLALGGPLGVRLTPTVASTITLRTPYEATEIVSADENILLSSAPLTVCKMFEKTTANGVKQVLIKKFSIDVNSMTQIPELPGFVVKGLNIENFKRTVKMEIKALDRPLTIQEYWSLWYTEMNESLFEYLNIVKETLEA